MRGIFFTADDLGISREANEAMVYAHVHGILHGAALMMGQPGTDQGVDLARQNPGLHVGFHLHLCDSLPLTLGCGGGGGSATGSRADWPWGSDPARAGWAIGTQRSARLLAEAEIARQWQEFRARGLHCAFVNAHHHLHVHPFVMEMLRDIVGPECGDAWWRWGRPRWFGRKGLSARMASAGWALVRAMSHLPAGTHAPQTLWGIDRNFQMDAGEIKDVLQTLKADFSAEPATSDSVQDLKKPLHEFMFHPRHIHPDDKDLQTLLKLGANAGDVGAAFDS
ncbi:MAG: ChbG/HpnK family deacetylase [Candidatus Methylacidiphilales bacterium]|nr:ChbG/HpnK family deacetylase [Candidatus Methylacidiphilales bacterium]